MEGVTLVLGASERPDRYANMAVRRLRAHGHAVLAVGRRPGRIGEVPIVTDIPDGARPSTVSLYLSPANQAPWRARILALRPERVIFNPGTEDSGFEAELAAAGITPIEGCTLVMLAAGTY